MTPQLTIPKDTTREPALDYRRLFDLGVQHAQRLARRLWTDYNTHDPGITTLELLCYAITDLSYRASFSIEDLLASETDNAKNMKKQFFTARQILPNRPLTLLDYRKLLIDLKGVKNAWVTPSRQTYYADKIKGILSREKPEVAGIVDINLAGLYDILLELGEEIDTPDAKQRVFNAARERLQGNRNLCEDLVTITQVESQQFMICTELELSADADVAKIEAEIFFQVQNYLAPPVHNYTLSEMLGRKHPDGRSYSVDEIFEGPVLDCGFFDDEELRNAELRTDIRLSDVINILMDVEGVLAVRDIVLNPEGTETPLANKWIVPVEPGKKADLKREQSRLVFYKRHMPVVSDSTKVETCYARLIEEARSKAETPFPYDLDIPLGRYRQTDRYTSFQKHFPAVYGISEAGLSESGMTKEAADVRKAQAYQLKAYLLFFDQIMANYVAQLHHVKELFSTDPSVPHTYRSQVVDSFTDYQKIYMQAEGENLDLTLQSLIEDAPLFEDRRHRFLDHLITRFAERFADYVNIMYSAFGANPDSLIATKCTFLQNYPAISSERGLAYNHTLKEDSDLWDSDNVSGLEKRLAALLGIPNRTRRNLGEIAFGIYAEVDKSQTDEFRFRIRNKDTGEILLSSSTKYATPAQANEAMKTVIRLAMSAIHYQRKQTSNGRHYFNVIDDTGDVLARRIEYFETEAEMNQAIEGVIQGMRTNFSDEGLYVIENILLRPEKPTDPFLPICPDPQCTDCSELDPYSYRVHIILPAESTRFRIMEFRRYVESVIREETPAHILPKICWIGEEDMKKLEKAYRDWIFLKAGKNTSRRKAKLAAFIETLYSVKNIYPVRLLHECDSPEDQPKFILGQHALGTQRHNHEDT